MNLCMLNVIPIFTTALFINIKCNMLHRIASTLAFVKYCCHLCRHQWNDEIVEMKSFFTQTSYRSFYIRIEHTFTGLSIPTIVKPNISDFCCMELEELNKTSRIANNRPKMRWCKTLTSYKKHTAKAEKMYYKRLEYWYNCIKTNVSHVGQRYSSNCVVHAVLCNMIYNIIIVTVNVAGRWPNHSFLW